MLFLHQGKVNGFKGSLLIMPVENKPATEQFPWLISTVVLVAAGIIGVLIVALIKQANKVLLHLRNSDSLLSIESGGSVWGSNPPKTYACLPTDLKSAKPTGTYTLPGKEIT
jgi:hypothetical protein